MRRRGEVWTLFRGPVKPSLMNRVQIWTWPDLINTVSPGLIVWREVTVKRLLQKVRQMVNKGKKTMKS